MTRLSDFYHDTVAKQLTEQFGYQSPMQVPRIEKITLNMGVGEAVGDKKIMENALNDLTLIAGQKPTSPLRASRWLLSRFVRAGRSVVVSRCGARACTSFSIG